MTRLSFFSNTDSFSEREKMILEYVRARQARCRDETVSVEELFYMDQWDSYARKTGDEELPLAELEISHYAETQLLTRLKMPASYIYRCPPGLKASNVNHWIKHFSSKQVMLRFEDNAVRAIFSSRFSTDLDDHELVPVVLDTLKASYHPDKVDILYFGQDRDFTVMEILFSDTKIKHNEEEYAPGIMIVNSEVGRSSIWVRPFIKLISGGRPFSLTRAYSFTDSRNEGSISIRHVGQLSAERLKKAILQAKEVAEAGVHRLLEAGTEKIWNPIPLKHENKYSRTGDTGNGTDHKSFQ